MSDYCGEEKSCIWQMAKRTGINPLRLCSAIDSRGEPCGVRTRVIVPYLDDDLEDRAPMLALCEIHYRAFIRRVDQLSRHRLAGLSETIEARERDRAIQATRTKMAIKTEKRRIEKEQKRADRSRQDRLRVERQRGHVYFAVRGERLKIGFSVRPHKRIHDLEFAAGAPFDEVILVKGTRALEGKLHRRFAEYRLMGEWFEAAPEIMDHARSQALAN